MDAKITKKRLNILLSYDWIKILLTAAAAILVWSLLFTMTATRVTQAQNFTIFNYTGTSVTSRFNSYENLLKSNGVFSYDVLEITPTDVTTGNEYSETLVQTRVSTGEGDALFAANVDLGVETEYSRPDGTTFHPTYLEQFLYNYFNTAEDLGEGGYFDDMAAYLNNYYYGDYTKGEADEQKIESDFLARIKKLNDKRFKTSEEKREGFQQEKERLEKQRTALISFLGYLDAGYVELQQTTLYFQDADGNPVEKTGYYSINLCPDERMSDLKNDVFYSKTVEVESGEVRVSAADDICLVLLNVAEDKYQYARFEGLSFVNYLIETHCSALQEN